MSQVRYGEEYLIGLPVPANVVLGNLDSVSSLFPYKDLKATVDAMNNNRKCVLSLSDLVLSRGNGEDKTIYVGAFLTIIAQEEKNIERICRELKTKMPHLFAGVDCSHNGYSNGHANGYSNGHSNNDGHVNGSVKKEGKK